MEKFLLKTVIIEGRSDAILELTELLNSFPSINIVGTSTTLDKGIEIIKLTNPNLIFLDVNLHYKSSLNIFNEFESPEFKIIFCSSKRRFMLRKSHKYASNYLFSPIDNIQLKETLQKVFNELLFERNIFKLVEALS